METMFIAVEKIKYLQPKPIFRKHTRVVQINVEETLEAAAFNAQLNAGLRNGIRHRNSKDESRKFKCLDCGATWTENIHSPLIMTSQEINAYYPAARNCSTFKY